MRNYDTTYEITSIIYTTSTSMRSVTTMSVRLTTRRNCSNWGGSYSWPKYSQCS